MKNIKFLTYALLCAFSINASWADEPAIRKKLLKPNITPTAIKPIQASDSAAGQDVSLNPQPFPPVESSKLPASGIKPAGTSLVKPLSDDLANARLDACMGKPCIISVNGKNVGNTTFKPGSPYYHIVGKKFGNVPGKVILNIDGDTAVQLDVAPQDWHDEEIFASFKNDFGGKTNSNNVALFIDLPNTPRITTINSQRGKFEALIVKQSIPFGSIPQSAITYEKGEFGDPITDVNGYAFYKATGGAKNTIDSIKHQFTDKIKLNFINPNFKIIEVNTVFGRVDTNGSRCAGCGAGSGGVYVYGSYGYALKSNNELWVSRAVWQNHVSPSMDWSNTLTGTLLGGPIGTIIGAASGINGKEGGNQFLSAVEKLEIVVEGPKGVNVIK